jgi:hypothetical protein
MKPPDTKRQMKTQKKQKTKTKAKMIRGMIKSVTQESYFEKKPNK